jgi:Undecaprenyl-phosphate glucose phosphotransferase
MFVSIGNDAMQDQAVRKPPREVAAAARAAERARLQQPEIPIGTASPISGPVVTGLLGMFDAAVVLGLGLIAIFWIAPGADWHFAGLVVLLGTILALNLQQLVGAYSFDRLADLEASVGQVLLAWLLIMGTILGLVAIAGAGSRAEHGWLVFWLAGGLATLLAARVGVYAMMRAWRRSGRLSHNVVVIGAGPLGQKLLRLLNTHTNPNLRILGVYDDRLGRMPERCMGHPILGSVDDLIQDARRHRVDQVIVALPLSADWRLSEVMNKLRLIPADVRVCADLFGFQLSMHDKRGNLELPLLNVMEKPLKDWRWVGKEIEDRLIASLILLLIAPLMLVIAAAIKLDSPGPVFFRQKRYGFNNRLITMLKFRTMYHHVQDPNAEQLTRRNDPRVTRIGAFLRRTSLDELPQFINVLRGEMSIVGPRPHALAAKAGGYLYQDVVKDYDSRHRMKPGITGWAQVNRWRGETQTVEQIVRRVEHDIYYVENWSILWDLRIILRTAFGGFTGNSAY